MSTVDLFTTVLYNDGEGLVHTDLNANSTQILAHITDQLMERRCPAIALGSDLGSAFLDLEVPGELGDRAIGAVIGNSVAFTSVAGECMIYPASNTTVKITAGTLFQKVQAADGSAPSLKPYTIKAADLVFTVQAGHASLPRYDIIQVQILDTSWQNETRDIQDGSTHIVTTQVVPKRQRYQLTAQYKAGTANATPVHPLPDAGFVALAAIRVPAAWTSGIDTGADVAHSGSLAIPMQVSIPLGVTSYVVTPEQFIYNGSANFSLNSSGSALAGAAATGLIIPGPPKSLGRVIGVSMEASWVTSGQVLVGRQSWTNVGGRVFATAADISGTMVTVGSTVFGFSSIGALDGNTNPFSSSQFAGDPIWANGTRVPSTRDLQVANNTVFPVATLNSTSRVALKVAAGNTSVIGPVRWWIAA